MMPLLMTVDVLMVSYFYPSQNSAPWGRYYYDCSGLNSGACSRVFDKKILKYQVIPQSLLPGPAELLAPLDSMAVSRGAPPLLLPANTSFLLATSDRSSVPSGETEAIQYQHFAF